MRTHGTRSSYNKGCRCDACTKAVRDYMRGYMRRAEVKARRKPERRDTCPCGSSKTVRASVCGSCANRARARDRRAWKSKQVVHIGPIPFTWLPSQHPVMREQAKQARRTFVSGACAWCGDPFTVASTTGMARYCSERCGNASAKAQHGRRFRVSPLVRLSIYERDDWTCQLCLEPVDRDLMTTEPYSEWAPSLDHIVCRSRGGSDDPENLRLAHRWCNSVRGDESYYTAADLVA